MVQETFLGFEIPLIDGDASTSQSKSIVQMFQEIPDMYALTHQDKHSMDGHVPRRYVESGLCGTQAGQNIVKMRSSGADGGEVRQSSPQTAIRTQFPQWHHRQITLALEALRGEDTSAIVIARGTCALDYGPAKLLGTYFSSYGHLKCMHVVHARIRTTRSKNIMVKKVSGDLSPSRRGTTAAAIVFIVMQSPAATARVLSDGKEHIVNDVTFTVDHFEHV
jgi:hypothetical protein